MWLKCITLWRNPSGCNLCTTDTCNSLHQHPFFSPSCTVLTSLCSASLMHLRTSQCYPTLQKEVDVSQSVSCGEVHTSHCCLCASSLIASLLTCALSRCGQCWELCLFHFTLTIDHFGESCQNESNAYNASAGLQYWLTLNTRCRLHFIYACFTSRNPMLISSQMAVIWQSGTLFMSAWDYARSLCISPHTFWKLACTCMCVNVCVKAWNTEWGWD